MKIEDRITGKTKLIGVIGNPIEHTISPQLHNTISSFFGVDLLYVPFRVEKDELQNAIKGLKAMNFLGFNITIPFKKEVMKYIDDNTKEALLMGAVNTVKNIDGRFYGYNTDAEGFSRSFKEEVRTGLKNKKVVLLGAGGAARAIAVKAAIEGAASISIINRSQIKSTEISEMVNNNFKRITKSYSYSDPEISGIIRGCDVIINATPVGMYPEYGVSPLEDFDLLTGKQIVFDTIYNPKQTYLLYEASRRGCKTINGLGMLFYQGINSYEIWTGIKIPEEVLKKLFDAFKTIIG
jgi:shikimate dehydrogenase